MKERIIGAVILVAFVWLVVPIFLDGPPTAEETVTERILLPGQQDQDTKTVILDRERSNPIPVANSTATAAAPKIVPQSDAQIETEPRAEPQVVVEQKPPVVETPVEDKLAAATSTPVSAPSATGMWAVQMGSFSNKENAEKLAASLRKQGYAAFLSELQTDSGQLHRVRIGPQKDRPSADAMAARLAKVGHQGQVLPHP